VSIRDERAEDALGAGQDRDDERELRHDRPEPAAGDEVAPALPQLVHQARPRRLRQGGEAHACAQRAGHGEAHRVGGQAPARAGQADQDTTQRRTTDLAAVTADAVQGVRWRTLVSRHRVRQEAFRGREVEAGPDAPQGGQGGEFPDPGVTGQKQGRRGGLAQRLERVRRHHDLVPGQPVRDHAAEQQEAD